MSLKDRYEEYRRSIRFADLDLASRTMAMLWLGIFRDRVFRSCFPRMASRSLSEEVGEVINSVYMEGYILARAAMETGTEAVVFTYPEIGESVERGVEKLRAMYENEMAAAEPFAGEPLGVEALAENIVREIAYGTRLRWLEERELLRVYLIYALRAGYNLARFERRIKSERD